jgi:hypothetical protein
MAFAKLKALPRPKALPIEELWKALGNLVGCFSATEWSNYLRYAGYFRSG